MDIPILGTAPVVNVTAMHSPHDLEAQAQLFTDRLLSVADTVAEPLRAQAIAFKELIRQTALQMFKDARHTDRVYLATRLAATGHTDIARQLKDL